MKVLTIRLKDGEGLKRVYIANRYTFNPISAEGFLLIEDDKGEIYIDLDRIEEMQVEDRNG